MSEGEAFLALKYFMEQQERVTMFKSTNQGDNDYYIEWFNIKGGYDYVCGPDLVQLVEKLK